MFIAQKCATKQGKGTAETGKDKHINGVIRLQKAYGYNERNTNTQLKSSNVV